MSSVKGKRRICQSYLNDFNVEQINGSPFYNRYVEFKHVFNKHIPELNPDTLFAQPIENPTKGTIDWYIPETQETPISLDSLKSTSPHEYSRYKTIKEDIIKFLDSKSKTISNSQERLYFDCATKYISSSYSDKIVFCHSGQITFVVWGMGMRKGRDINTIITDDVKDHRIHTITYQVQGDGHISGNSSITRKHGHILSGKNDIPEIVPDPHNNFVEWIPEAPHGKVVNEDLTYTAICRRTDDYIISFVCSEGGSLLGPTIVSIKPGNKIDPQNIPSPTPNEGFEFIKWDPQIITDNPVNDDVEYCAVFKNATVNAPLSPEEPPTIPPNPKKHVVNFLSGDGGKINGVDSIEVEDGNFIPTNCIPSVLPNKGLKFSGWNRSISEPITNDINITAQYSKVDTPWYKRFWLWFTGLFASKGCFIRLLWILASFLLLVLFLWLLRNCNGCSDHRTPINGVIPIDSVNRSDGQIMDNNGITHPITGSNGKLPDGDGIVAPVLGDGWTDIPIIEQPGTPNIVANRLFLFMEDENDDIELLAQDFKTAYPGENYSIIGFDKEVKLLVIQIPEEERTQISQTINARIPNHKFIVFDEEIYELNGFVSNTDEDKGWHLDAIHLKEGWSYTDGSPDVKVAVVDDGIQSSHPMFNGKIVDAYNVFTQNNHLSPGEGHGTHTAGLAVGSADTYNSGASGVAPKCKLIPIQVFDNKKCPLSALVAGVMYAIHHDADVVNISIGPSFKGLNVLPVDEQNKIANNQFKNVASLWTRVCKLAAQKRTILVFAAGNDDILSSIPPENRNESCIVVTAVDKRMYPTVFTNYGPCSDISAPGKNIYSSWPTSTYLSCDGTSMAAPIVSGTIALMKSIKKDITVTQARNALYSTGADVYGWIPPMVLVDKALIATREGNFDRVMREGKSVPDSVDVHMNSGTIPPDNQYRIIDRPIPSPVDASDTNYDEIRRQIKELEKRIQELRNQLPENQ